MMYGLSFCGVFVCVSLNGLMRFVCDVLYDVVCGVSDYVWFFYLICGVVSVAYCDIVWFACCLFVVCVFVCVRVGVFALRCLWILFVIYCVMWYGLFVLLSVLCCGCVCVCCNSCVYVWLRFVCK